MPIIFGQDSGPLLPARREDQVRVYVDDEVFEGGLGPESTVADLLEAVRSDLSGDRRILWGIRADGLDIAGDRFAETLGKAAASFERFDFITADPHQVVAEALDECSEVLDAAETQRRETIDRLTQGDHASGASALGECCRAWQQVQEAICNSVGLLGLEFGALQINGEPFAAVLAGARDQLIQVREALLARDFVLVSDILEYEFEPIIQAWRGAIQAVGDAART